MHPPTHPGSDRLGIPTSSNKVESICLSNFIQLFFELCFQRIDFHIKTFKEIIQHAAIIHLILEKHKQLEVRQSRSVHCVYQSKQSVHEAIQFVFILLCLLAALEPYVRQHFFSRRGVIFNFVLINKFATSLVILFRIIL